jgi:hypothetical protein
LKIRLDKREEKKEQAQDSKKNENNLDDDLKIIYSVNKQKFAF